MPTLKAITKGYVRRDGKQQIFIRVIHRRRTNFVTTGYYIDNNFVQKDGTISPRYSNYTKLMKSLNGLIMEFEDIIINLGPQLRKMTVRELCVKLRNTSGGDFFEYFKKKMAGVKHEGTRQIWNASLTALQAFRDTLTFGEVNGGFIEDFAAELTKTVSPNTARNYLYKLKLVYDAALHDGIVQGQPLRIPVKAVRTKRMALTSEELKKLFAIKSEAADFFKLSFCLCGINAKDLLTLPPSKGYIIYKRLKIQAKQDIELRVKIQAPAEEIIKRYKGKRYLLKYLDSDDSFANFHSTLQRLNKYLKQTGEDLEFDIKLTSGLTRHSWSTLAKSLGVSDSDIDLALGHNLNSVTGGYISYQQLMDRVDKANMTVLAAVGLLPAS